MATVDPTNLVQTPEDYGAEVARARKLAERYRLEFVDMDDFRIDQDLFRSIPADLMLRYGFVPHRRGGKGPEIFVFAPSGLPMKDGLGVPLAGPFQGGDGPQAVVEALLNKKESAPRALG